MEYYGSENTSEEKIYFFPKNNNFNIEIKIESNFLIIIKINFFYYNFRKSEENNGY